MMRNDYRRSLILLRSNAPGFSGHVRLERRTLMGSMYFMVQAPERQEKLQAALVGRGRDSYYACVMGELKRDSRGQAVLSWSFDPRNICGRELEQYQIIAVAATAGNDCRIVLYGNVDGHAELNWERVRQAVCLSLNPAPRPVPQPQAAPPEPRSVPEEEAVPAEEPEAGEKAETENIPSAAKALEAAEAREADEAPSIITAAEVLGLDTTMPWPDEVEELRRRFAVSEPLDGAPDNGYVYIRVPAPEGSPYGYMAVGLRAENGLPIAVSYALPAAYTAEIPAGLEEYTWIGDNNSGWWVAEIILSL